MTFQPLQFDSITAPYAYHFRKALNYEKKGNSAAAIEQYALFKKEISSAELGNEDADIQLAMFLFAAGEHDLVLEIYERYQKTTENDLWPIMAAAIFFARNQPVKALVAAKYIHDFEQRRLRQKTAELWSRLHAPLDKEPRVHLLILTCNREQYVTQALEQLAATEYSNYAVYMADNGSSDNTLALVRKATELFPENIPIHIDSFPTNIGRPAGHNWLLTGHDHSGADYIAIGDDDLVRVPQNWLTRMIQTIKAFPGCGCVGGKALTPGWPLSVHGGVRRFIEFGLPHSFKMTNPAESVDLGQFDYVDMVDHVIGCLHIFDRKALIDAGLFDISLSPCQCVDIEHHLRMILKDIEIIYNGLISFEHHRAMGAMVKHDASLAGNSIGNVFKILHKYDAGAVNSKLSSYRSARNKWLSQ